jgi:glycosyltransferase involved in cell wall biosynthesis
MRNALVSVVIPTYNRSAMLCRALESVQSQTHKNWEALVVDDGSTDGTAAVLAERYGGDPRIKYCYQENGGPAGARNRAMEMASGEFIAFLDSDDVWEPWKLELQLACFKAEPGIGLVWTNMVAVDGDDRVVNERYLATMYRSRRMFSDEQLFDRSYPLSKPENYAPADQPVLKTGNIFSQMVTGSLVHTSTVMLRRDWQRRVGPFRPEFRPLGEDFDFHLRTTRLGRVGFVDISSIQYQIGMPGALTERTNMVSAAKHFLKTIEPVIENERDKIELPDSMIRDTLAYGYRWYGTELVLKGECVEARAALCRSLRERFSGEVLMFWGLSWLPAGLTQALRKFRRSVSLRWRQADRAGEPIAEPRT